VFISYKWFRSWHLYEYCEYTVQITVTSLVLTSLPWVEVEWPAFCLHFHFMWHASSSSLHKNNCIRILLACSRQQPCPCKYTSLTRIYLCCRVEYGLSVVNLTSFVCFSSVTYHLLSAISHSSIETRCHVILLFLFSGGMHLSSIQERLI